MNYTIKYKLEKSWFWKTIKNVKGDGILSESNARWFILDDESRIEIPIQGTIFEFSKERHYLIKENMNKEMGKI